MNSRRDGRTSADERVPYRFEGRLLVGHLSRNRENRYIYASLGKASGASAIRVTNHAMK
jgi:hypothetical protein